MEPDRATVVASRSRGGAEDFMLNPLNDLAQHIAVGALRVQIGRIFTLDDIAAAHRCMECNAAGGGIVVLTRRESGAARLQGAGTGPLRGAAAAKRPR